MMMLKPIVIFSVYRACKHIIIKIAMQRTAPYLYVYACGIRAGSCENVQLSAYIAVQNQIAGGKNREILPVSFLNKPHMLSNSSSSKIEAIAKKMPRRWRRGMVKCHGWPLPHLVPGGRGVTLPYGEKMLCSWQIIGRNLKVRRWKRWSDDASFASCNKMEILPTSMVRC